MVITLRLNGNGQPSLLHLFRTATEIIQLDGTSITSGTVRFIMHI